MLLTPLVSYATTVESYQPMHNGDVWNYQGYLGKFTATTQAATFGGRAVFRFSSSLLAAAYSYNGYSGEQLLEFGSLVDGETRTYTPPFINLDGNKMNTEGTWSSTVPVTAAGATSEETLTLSAKKVGKVTVAAGAFENCIEVSGVLSVPAAAFDLEILKEMVAEGLLPQSILDDILLLIAGTPRLAIYAPGVGVIKSAVYVKGKIAGWSELTGGTVDGRTIGTGSGTVTNTTATVGAARSFGLPDAFAGAAKVTVKGLPAGLKYNTATKMVEGVPTKAGTFDIVISATGVTAQTIKITVAALPTWAQGSFSGYVEGTGLATMTVSAAGKVTGKISMAGTNYAFSAASYKAGGSAEEGFAVEATAKAGKTALPLTLTVTQAGSLPMFGVVSGQLGVRSVSLSRDMWKTEVTKLNTYIGYYTATLPGNAEHGSGYLTFTVDKAGKVKTAGKLADGTAVSQSGTLIMDENERFYTVVYTAPKAYNGGALFGLAEFDMLGEDIIGLRARDGIPLLWQSRNPQATGIQGAGFIRSPELVGGRYSKTEDLGAYYAGKNLTAGADTDALLPALTVGAVRYDSACWNPTGIALMPTLKSGAMAGLSAPVAGKPVDPDKDGVWDYSATNSVGLKISLTRPTGIFKGTFLAWFDYPVNKHTSKSLAFEGTLTPVRENPDDGVAGRGFFLWPDKSLSPAYAFKWSYDFKILQSAP